MMLSAVDSKKRLRVTVRNMQLDTTSSPARAHQKLYDRNNSVRARQLVRHAETVHTQEQQRFTLKA